MFLLCEVAQKACPSCAAVVLPRLPNFGIPRHASDRDFHVSTAVHLPRCHNRGSRATATSLLYRGYSAVVAQPRQASHRDIFVAQKACPSCAAVVLPRLPNFGILRHASDRDFHVSAAVHLPRCHNRGSRATATSLLCRGYSTAVAQPRQASHRDIFGAFFQNDHTSLMAPIYITL
ncbi:hypothetical protein LWI29_012511 [Acer saccharum]|uniref:Uncharacterized protein n=1 Tax=Acer saccharum TaxID=4024 RepID=A0AA39VRL5_ACESA|nr:hypothetical protein LWI29_012511 [Acer saccharum]